ncbi:MAG TPA: alpha/beta hydrolase, partial [Mycobacterium sp.]
MKAALGVGAALGGLAVTLAYLRDMRAAYGRLAGASRLVDTSHGVVEVAEEGAGRTVLAIHGAAGGFDMGLSLARSVIGAGYRIVAPSRFGYLRSPMRKHASHADQADALADLL